MFLGQAATLALLLAGEEVVMLNLNDGHADTLGLQALHLLTTPIVQSPQLSDLVLVFRGEQVREHQQATGQRWHHQHLTSSEKKVLKTFFPIFQIADVTVGLRAHTEGAGQSYDGQRQPFPFELGAQLQIELHVEVSDDAHSSCKYLRPF